MTLALPDPDVRALATGEAITAFARRGSVEIGDEVDLVATGPCPPKRLKPAYARWANAGAPDGPWSVVVEGVHPSALLDPESGASRHILSAVPDGDLLVLRVYGPEGPVLSDVAFEARRNSVEGALTL